MIEAMNSSHDPLLYIARFILPVYRGSPLPNWQKISVFVPSPPTDQSFFRFMRTIQSLPPIQHEESSEGVPIFLHIEPLRGNMKVFSHEIQTD
jgi:hypothetical protein